MGSFAKRDIVEVAEELGLDLVYHEFTDRPYYTGFCPFPDHDNTKTPAFALWPKRQRWVCYGCRLEGGDVIDLVKNVKQCSFGEAKRIATVTITDEEAFQRELAKAAVATTGNSKSIILRSSKINDDPRTMAPHEVQNVLRAFDYLIAEERWLEADKLLRVNGY